MKKPRIFHCTAVVTLIYGLPAPSTAYADASGAGHSATVARVTTSTPAPLAPSSGPRAVVGAANQRAATGSEQAEDAEPVLAQLIEQALLARPEIASARAAVQAERERISQAGAWPDPMLQIGMQNDGFTGIEVGRMPTSFYSLMASQTIPWPGKLGLRQDIVDSTAKQSQYAVQRARLSTEAEVRRGYLGLLLARDRLAILERLERVWERSLNAARARYEAGQGVLAEVLRSRLELQRLAQKRVALQVQERLQLQQLNRLRAHPLHEPIPTTRHVRDLPRLAPDHAVLSLETARALCPELAIARLRVVQAGKTTQLAKRNYYPDLTVSAGIMYRGTVLPPMWLVTVAAPVPIFSGSKQSRAVAENVARAEVNRFDADEIEQVLRLRVEERQASIAALEEADRLFRAGLLEQSAMTIDNTLAQYVVGKVPLASVLEANAGYLADEESYLQLLADAQLVRIAAREVSLEPTPTTGGTAMRATAISNPAVMGTGSSGVDGAPSGM